MNKRFWWLRKVLSRADSSVKPVQRRLMVTLGRTDRAIRRQYEGNEQRSETLAHRANEERFRALSDASSESIFVSEKGICLDQNQTAEKMFGYTHTEAVGRLGMEWIIPEDRERVKNNILSGHEEIYEVTAQRKDGTTFPAEIQAHMINYKERSMRVTALRDITDRKRTEAELERQMGALQEINRRLEVLTYNVSEREKRMVLLKQEVNELLVVAGGEPKYRAVQEVEKQGLMSALVDGNLEGE
ncbi:MAG: PAS domain S-box protein [Proteobacteria bacterium]|nr:PAS domain S-box protein [Pseudomonadota bacterium]